MNKYKFGPPLDSFCPQFWGGSSATSPLKIWDVMLHYLKTIFEQKQEIDNFDHLNEKYSSFF